MTLESPRNLSERYSRRSLLCLLGASPLVLASCRSLRTPDNSPDDLADRQIKSVVAGYEALARSHPGLPGVQSLADVNERLVEGFSPADLSLLAAALSLEASEQVVRIPRPIAMTDVRSALSRPIDMAPYGRSFLERTLAEARAREGTDPAYRRKLGVYRKRCYCLTGHTPCWICIAIALIIIIALIAILI